MREIHPYIAAFQSASLDLAAVLSTSVDAVTPSVGYLS